MALISLQNISIHFGGPLILDNLNLQIESRQRVCLLGRNGTGKSTLMKIIEGELIPDAGEVITEQGMRAAYCAQDIPNKIEGSVFNVVAHGLGERGKLLINYNNALNNPTTSQATINTLYEQLESHRAWSVMEEVEKVLTKLELNPQLEYTQLSGGQKRRVMLAAALVSEPDILLLDEPTNHLDVASIEWLEQFLIKNNITLLFVTHDRTFLKNVATRIIELDRGKLVDWSCDYETFLQRKQAVLDAEEKDWERFDKKLAQEEVWIRKGIKARRTRNEGRVRALKKMRTERSLRRQREGSVSMRLQEAQKSGTLVLEVKDILFSYGSTPLIKHFSTIIARGDKVGIIGANGSGKTTLINLLLGKLKPQSGTIQRGTNLEISYFDQLRAKIDDSKTVWENVLPNGDMVQYNGKSKHIITYLQDFLFTPERAKTTAKNLSGGERNRLLLAKLFTLPSNFLVFDEPTNDLDSETLELLEELLSEFAGTILLISHDRTFLDNVVTTTYALEGDGTVNEYVGGYDEWVKQSAHKKSVKQALPANKPKKKQFNEGKKAKRKNKLSYNEKKELEILPEQIEEMEEEQAHLHKAMSQPDFYKGVEAAQIKQTRLTELEEELSQLYNRWEALSAKEG